MHSALVRFRSVSKRRYNPLHYATRSKDEAERRAQIEVGEVDALNDKSGWTYFGHRIASLGKSLARLLRGQAVWKRAVVGRESGGSAGATPHLQDVRFVNRESFDRKRDVVQTIRTQIVGLGWAVDIDLDTPFARLSGEGQGPTDIG